MYLVWYDDNPQKPVGAKIDEAIVRYRQRYGRDPQVCMLHDELPAADYNDLAAHNHIQVMTAKNVPQNYFWVGNAA